MIRPSCRRDCSCCWPHIHTSTHIPSYLCRRWPILSRHPLSDCWNRHGLHRLSLPIHSSQRRIRRAGSTSEFYPTVDRRPENSRCRCCAPVCHHSQRQILVLVLLSASPSTLERSQHMVVVRTSGPCSNGCCHGLFELYELSRLWCTCPW